MTFEENKLVLFFLFFRVCVCVHVWIRGNLFWDQIWTVMVDLGYPEFYDLPWKAVSRSFIAL